MSDDQQSDTKFGSAGSSIWNVPAYAASEDWHMVEEDGRRVHYARRSTGSPLSCGKHVAFKEERRLVEQIHETLLLYDYKHEHVHNTCT